MKLLLLFITLCFGTAASVGATETPSVINVEDKGTHFELSFSCDPTKTYSVYASEQSDESGQAMWFQIKSVQPGQPGYSTLSVVDGMDIATTTLPKPLFSWSTNTGPGFVRIEEVMPPTTAFTRESIVPVTEFRSLGAFDPADRDSEDPLAGIRPVHSTFRVTFESEPGVTYQIWGSSDLKRWDPVDTIENGRVYQTFEVFGAEGETTTVDLPVPFTPWLDPNRAFVQVTRKSPSFFGFSGFSGVAALAVAPEDPWNCVCVGDARNHSPSFRKGGLSIDITYSAPKRTEIGKYHYVSASMKAKRRGLLGDFNVNIPWTLPIPGKADRQIVQIVMLSTYDEAQTPTVLFIRDPEVVPGHDDILSAELSIRSGTIIGAAVFMPKQIVGPVVEVEQAGAGFSVKLPTGEGGGSVQLPFTFMPMKTKQYTEWVRMLKSAGQYP